MPTKGEKVMLDDEAMTDDFEIPTTHPFLPKDPLQISELSSWLISSFAALSLFSVALQLILRFFSCDHKL